MSSITCAHCGVLNAVADEVCGTCGAELEIVTSSFVDEDHEWQPTTNPHSPIPGIHSFDGVSDVVGPTIKLFSRNLWLITKIVFVVVAPFEVFKVMSFSGLEHDWQLTAGTFLLGLVCKILIAPALIYALMKTIQTGVRPGINESYRWGLTKLGKLAVCAAIAWVLQALGYMFLIIPGIIIGLAFEVVYPIAILEKGSVAEVLRRSSELTRGHRLKILAAEIVMGFLLGIINVPAGFLTVENAGVAPAAVVAAIVVDITEQVTTVLSLVIYLSILRTSRFGQSIFSLAK